MTTEQSGFFVLTGGPGSGKTTLIDALSRMGYACAPEAGRAVIQDQAAIGGRALPWDDRALFAELMLCLDMRAYHAACGARGLVFFDRGIPDIVGYLRLEGLPVPAHLRNAASMFRYNRRVFIAPPWQEIFTQDAERKQDFAEAVRTLEAMKEAYGACGYELIELPRAPVAERVAFIVQRAGHPSSLSAPWGRRDWVRWGIPEA